MRKKFGWQLNALMIMCTLRSVCNSKSVSETSMTRMIVDEVTDDSKQEAIKRKCEELPKILLAQLLGEAYNSRYMSINRPITSDDGSYVNDNDRNAYSVVKRRVENIPSFYVEEKHALELSEKPVWDIREHTIEELRASKVRRKRLAPIEPSETLPPSNGLDEVAINGTDTQARNRRAYGRNGSSGSGKNDPNKLYPWKCDATIKWVDLGPDYFPRFLRTVECTKHYCWYKAFVCKAKSFAVKILHRRKGSCADAENLRKITTYDFRGEFGEIWTWEEVAINFCCDCSMA